MNALKMRLVSVFLVLVATMASGVPASAEDSVSWQTYDVTVDVREDGSLHITESIEVEFDGVFTEGHRSIPMERIESIEDVRVSVEKDEGELSPAAYLPSSRYSGEPGTFTALDAGNELTIDYGFLSTQGGGGEVRTIVLEYVALGVIRVYPDSEPARQEIRWTAISPEVTGVGPVESASATIIFPEAIEDSEATRFDPRPTSTTPTSVIWERDGLGEGESLMVLASFPALTGATEPAWQAEAEFREGREEKVPGLAILAGMMATVGFGLMMLVMWRRGGRDPEVGLIVDILSKPPSDLPAPLVGGLVNELFDTKDAIGMLMDLDRRGVLRIRAGKEATSTEKDDPKRFRIDLLEDIGDAPAWAVPMLEGLFGKDAKPGKSVSFEKLKTLRAEHNGEMSLAVEKELFDQGFYEELPGLSRKRWWLRAGAGLLLAGGVIGAIALWSRAFSPWLIGTSVLVFLLFILTLVMSVRAPKKTIAGAEEAAKWRAFGRYLEQMGQEMPLPDRLALFDKYLPWVVVLGYDKSSMDWMGDDSYSWRSGHDVHTYRSSGDSGPGSRPGGSFNLQGMSNRGLGGAQTANLSMFAVLNSAMGTFESGSGSSGGSGGSGSSSVGSSGGGGHSFS